MRILPQILKKRNLARRSSEGLATYPHVTNLSENSNTFEPILNLSQRPEFAGLSAELRMTSSRIPIQAKMRLGEVNDRYEQEADRLAPLIVQQINAAGFGEPLQDSQSEIQDDAPSKQLQALRPTLQLKGESTGGVVSPAIESAIDNARGGGQTLEPELQKRFGQAMGANFSRVRVHTNLKADQLNQTLGSWAFTTKQDVFFRQGKYQPGRIIGQKLIAHELAHVVQQKIKNSQKIIQKNGSDSSWMSKFKSTDLLYSPHRYENDVNLIKSRGYITAPSKVHRVKGDRKNPFRYGKGKATKDGQEYVLSILVHGAEPTGRDGDGTKVYGKHGKKTSDAMEVRQLAEKAANIVRREPGILKQINLYICHAGHSGVAEKFADFIREMLPPEKKVSTGVEILAVSKVLTIDADGPTFASEDYRYSTRI